MKIHTVIRKGEDHPVFCEDFTTFVDHGRFFLGVVLDGCSGGRESHFASALYGKLFRQVAREEPLYGETIEDKAKVLMQKFVRKLIESKVIIGIEPLDLLSTFVLLMYDKVHGEALVINVGDGVIFCDGKYFILENKKFKNEYPEDYQNRPDYIAYELSGLTESKTYFNEWYEKFVGKYKFVDPKNIAISTDGVLTFTTPETDVNVFEFLFEDEKFIDSEIMLSKKINILRKVHKTVHKDDVSIVRLIINSEKNDNSNN